MITVFGWSVRAPSQLTRLVVVSALSVSVMYLDHRGQHLDRLRNILAVVLRPVQYVAALPPRVGTTIADFFTASDALRAELAALQTEREQMSARLQQFEALEAENQRLRDRLGAGARVADRVLAAELIEVSTDPSSRKIILAKGARHGVYVGQPVIDADGVLGQVTQVAYDQARVTLITDPGHAIPVLVNRSALRAIVFGTGAQDTLKVPHLTAAADIREGDLLVSSGMGSADRPGAAGSRGATFPPGYPVARVVKIVRDPNESFLDITVVPVGRLNHNKQALLIWPGGKPPASAAGGTGGGK